MEQLSFCAKFQAGANGAQTCSTQDGALAVHCELCEAIPTAISTAGCTTYLPAQFAILTNAEQPSYCSSQRPSGAVALACTRLPSQHALRVMFDLCLNLATAALNGECGSSSVARSALNNPELFIYLLYSENSKERNGISMC